LACGREVPDISGIAFDGLKRHRPLFSRPLGRNHT
jgi:hypothetical protein